MRLAEVPWPAIPAGAVLVVPLGATEQHGPHLPFGTDTVVAEALAARLDAARGDVVVAPALAYGSSGEHAGFAGTLSIGQHGFELAVTELVRSADAFGATVLVSGHGGNAAPLARAVATLTGEGRRVLAWSPGAHALATATRDVAGDTAASAPDAHAGRTETSLMLALAPDDVRAEAAEGGERRPVAELAGRLRAEGVRAVSPNGVLGDPAGATADEGRRMLDALSDDLVATVAAWLR